ncbi:MAG TPA: hypothetical protein PKV36_05060 [Leptospiraceae bacterium]|nr:hypothetical protein [Leptospiraceae bacterium]
MQTRMDPMIVHDKTFGAGIQVYSKDKRMEALFSPEDEIIKINSCEIKIADKISYEESNNAVIGDDFLVDELLHFQSMFSDLEPDEKIFLTTIRNKDTIVIEFSEKLLQATANSLKK